MPALRSDVDPDGLLEYSVVYATCFKPHVVFQQVMNDLSSNLT